MIYRPLRERYHRGDMPRDHSGGGYAFPTQRIESDTSGCILKTDIIQSNWETYETGFVLSPSDHALLMDRINL